MKELLVAISSLSMKEQEAAMSKAMHDWMGGLEQVDDILVIGISA